jgi:hypothetical protein
MSKEVDEIYSKFSTVILSRHDEIKKFLIRHFSKALKEQLVEDVQKIDSTKRIKTAGFHPKLSGWKNAYNNIIVSSCEEVKGKQKRFDYKFLFVEEKLDDKTIERIQSGMDEASRLRKEFKFDEAVEKIDEMIELIRKEEDKVFDKRLSDARKEILTAKNEYEKGMAQIEKLKARVKENQKLGNLEEVVKDCEKIVVIADKIGVGPIKREYAKILDQTKKLIEALKDIERLEKQIQMHRTNENYGEALKLCDKAIEIAKSIKRQDLVDKFTQLKEEIEKEASDKIAELEKDYEKKMEAEDLEGAISDCIRIIKIAEDTDKNDIAEKYSKLRDDLKSKIAEAKDWYDKILKEMEEEIKEFDNNRKQKKLEEALKNCTKIIELAESIDKQDIVKKYKKFYDEISKELEELEAAESDALKEKELQDLINAFEKKREEGDLKEALEICQDIIELAEALNKKDVVKKYRKLYDQISKELGAREAAAAEEEAAEAAKAAAAAEALQKQEQLLVKAKEIGEIIEIEENVLPLIEEFSAEDVLGDMSGNINESMEQINALLDEHRVEVKNEVANKAVLTSASGEVVELEKNIEIEEPESSESPIISFQSGFENPFDDAIEEAIISDIIPYNYEISKIELNGKVVEELPDHTLTEDGLELNWKLQNIQPKEKVEINYDLRRRISRTAIFLLEDQLKIVKTHSNIQSIEDIEGLHEAQLPFSNTYGSDIEGVIVEDIIPLYYLSFIKEPTDSLPDNITSADQGELIKWNVGNMEPKTLNYHYKLLDLYKFEQLKILITKLNKDGLAALHEDELDNSLGKFSEITKLLNEYIA